MVASRAGLFARQRRSMRAGRVGMCNSLVLARRAQVEHLKRGIATHDAIGQIGRRDVIVSGCDSAAEPASPDCADPGRQRRPRPGRPSPRRLPARPRIGYHRPDALHPRRERKSRQRHDGDAGDTRATRHASQIRQGDRAERRAFVEARDPVEHRVEHGNAGEHAADHADAVEPAGGGRDARRAGTQSADQESGAEDHASDGLRHDEGLRQYTRRRSSRPI